MNISTRGVDVKFGWGVGGSGGMVWGDDRVMVGWWGGGVGGDVWDRRTSERSGA